MCVATETQTIAARKAKNSTAQTERDQLDIGNQKKPHNLIAKGRLWIFGKTTHFSSGQLLAVVFSPHHCGVLVFFACIPLPAPASASAASAAPLSSHLTTTHLTHNSSHTQLISHTTHLTRNSSHTQLISHNSSHTQLISHTTHLTRNSSHTTHLTQLISHNSHTTHLTHNSSHTTHLSHNSSHTQFISHNSHTTHLILCGTRSTQSFLTELRRGLSPQWPRLLFVWQAQ